MLYFLENAKKYYRKEIGKIKAVCKKNILIKSISEKSKRKKNSN